ncbi:hypothetical protein Hbl1158_03530 [Halobaculum sp. CBA1158]|uniref:DUF6684 family protein n=1 Tax=Halobaculum sp. CBA1158 TaxID=2904243 RepID=UPI001F1E5291|nr:DUF6684 family protein [Halobaculum sp. CBA1158]UIP00448.1 hypothetical protein Hbl1158_03530 [Halobaculum sp. CBA1158]
MTDDSAGDTDRRDGDSASDANSDEGSADGTDSVFSGRTLSDLLVNAVPLAMLAAFVAGFELLSPAGLDTDPLVGFHAALIAGVVLVSYVAARAVVAAGGDLDGERSVSLYDDGDDGDEGDDGSDEGDVGDDGSDDEGDRDDA